MTWRIAVAALALAALPACFKLDPFLYTPQRTDHYELHPEGQDPESTIEAGQIREPFFITVDEQVRLGAVYVQATVQPPRAYAIFFHGKGPHLAAWSNDGKRLIVTADDQGHTPVFTIDAAGGTVERITSLTNGGAHADIAVLKDGRLAGIRSTLLSTLLSYRTITPAQFTLA